MKHITLLSCSILTTLSGSACATTLLLADNFNSGSYGASTFNDTLATDQSGTLATVGYSVTTSGQDWQAQHGNGNAMLLAGSTTATVGLNHDFSADANSANQPLQVQFDGYVDNTPGWNWFSFAMGSAENVLAFDGSAKFGILPTTQGTMQVYASGSSPESPAFGTPSFTLLFSDTTGTGSAFNGNGSVVKLYSGTNLINTYTLAQMQAGDGYLSFGSDPWDGWSLAHVDNLSVSLIPEPQSAALAAFGFLALMRRRRLADAKA